MNDVTLILTVIFGVPGIIGLYLFVLLYIPLKNKKNEIIDIYLENAPSKWHPALFAFMGSWSLTPAIDITIKKWLGNKDALHLYNVYKNKLTSTHFVFLVSQGICSFFFLLLIVFILSTIILGVDVPWAKS